MSICHSSMARRVPSAGNPPGGGEESDPPVHVGSARDAP
jgi:hypothetical protein